MIVLEVKDVWKIYKVGEEEVAALAGVSLKINEGEFISIMGPSGSGKSTLMNMIGLLDRPTKGKVFLEGKNTSEMSEKELAKARGRKIGFVFQKYNLINTLTALENVTLPMIFQKISEEERVKRARGLLKIVNMSHRENHKPSELSGGEQQRIAIARALAMNPKIILADEPTGNLDSKTEKKIMEIFIQLNKKFGHTVILVTHDPEVASYAQKIIRIKDGKIIS